MVEIDLIISSYVGKLTYVMTDVIDLINNMMRNGSSITTKEVHHAG